MVTNQQVIAEHPRHFAKNVTVFDPWHYLPILEKKPGALRHGAPFAQLPAAINSVRQHMLRQEGGDAAFVELLLTGRELGVEVLEVACELAISEQSIYCSIIINTMRRLTEVQRPAPLDASTDQSLRIAPHSDYSRYDYLLGGGYVH